MDNKFPFKVLLPEIPDIKDEKLKRYFEQLHRVLDDIFRQNYQQHEIIRKIFQELGK